MSDRLGRAVRIGETAEYTIYRTGARPYVGDMTPIGTGAVFGTGTTMRVTIYRRKCGRYVVARQYLTIWEGSHDRYEAVLANTPEDVLAELGGDDMRPAEQQAWEQAANGDYPALAAIASVEI